MTHLTGAFHLTVAWSQMISQLGYLQEMNKWPIFIFVNAQTCMATPTLVVLPVVPSRVHHFCHCYLIHSYFILNPNCVILSLELPKLPMKVKQLLYTGGIFLVTTTPCKVCDCIVVLLPLIVNFVVKVWKWFSYELLRLRQCINCTATTLLVEEVAD